MHDKNHPTYERPSTPPPTTAGPQLPHKPGQEWDTPTIARVRQMKHDGCSASDIQKQLHVPPRTQRTICTQNLHTDRRPGAARRGCPPKIDLDTVHKMECHIHGRYKKRTLDWEGLGIETGVEALGRTIKRRMNNAGYKKCRACQKKWLSDANITKRWDISKEWRYLTYEPYTTYVIYIYVIHTHEVSSELHLFCQRTYQTLSLQRQFQESQCIERVYTTSFIC